MAKKITQQIVDTGFVFHFYFPELEGFSTGMTLRDYFAGQVLTTFNFHPIKFSTTKLAEKCYQVADEMLEQRKTK